MRRVLSGFLSIILIMTPLAGVDAFDTAAASSPAAEGSAAAEASLTVVPSTAIISSWVTVSARFPDEYESAGLYAVYFNEDEDELTQAADPGGVLPDYSFMIYSTQIMALRLKLYRAGDDNPDIVDYPVTVLPSAPGFSSLNVVEIARGELGYREGRNNYNKYATWYGSLQFQPWCAIFSSWALNTAGHGSLVGGKFASVSAWWRWYTGQGRAMTRESGYVPQPGDLVFYDWLGEGGTGHVGIVTAVEPEHIFTIEGNRADAVTETMRARNLDTITGYGANFLVEEKSEVRINEPADGSVIPASEPLFVSWASETGARIYDIELYENGKPVWSRSVNTLSYNINGAFFKPGNAYRIDVKANGAERNMRTSSVTVTADGDMVNEPSGWAGGSIDEAMRRNLVTERLSIGYQTDATREEFCEAAVRFLEVYYGKPVSSILRDRRVSSFPLFEDTDNPGIEAAAALGIAGGIGDGMFRPNRYITRQEAAVMLANTLRAIGFETSGHSHALYRDMDQAAAWALEGIEAVTARGIMQGTVADGIFSPLSRFTVEQSIVAFNRLYNHAAGIDDEDMPAIPYVTVTPRRPSFSGRTMSAGDILNFSITGSNATGFSYVVRNDDTWEYSAPVLIPQEPGETQNIWLPLDDFLPGSYSLIAFGRNTPLATDPGSIRAVHVIEFIVS